MIELRQPLVCVITFLAFFAWVVAAVVFLLWLNGELNVTMKKQKS